MNDYIECLVFAGWIEPGFSDFDYQSYLNATWGNQDDTMTYQEWCDFTEQHKQDIADYDLWCEEHKPYQPGIYNPNLEKEAHDKLRSLSWNEWELRY